MKNLPGVKARCDVFFVHSNSHKSESYRLVRFGVEKFDGMFGVGFGVAFMIYSKSESESRFA